MKGIGILLMLMGHWPNCPHWLHQFIYSFHMPLFFIVAGFFAKPLSVTIGQTVLNNAKRLLLPFVVTQTLLVIWGAWQSIEKQNVSYFIKPLLSLVWGCSDAAVTQWGNIYVGPVWFLLALFWSKTIFGFLAKKFYKWNLLLTCVGLSIGSNMLHKYVSIPWCLLQGLSGLVFMSAGYLIKEKCIPRWTCWVCFACWPIAIAISGMEMSCCDYRFYPLDILGACGGTLCVYYLSKQVRAVKRLATPVSWLGLNSLVILCFHDFEWFSSIAYSIKCRLPFEIQGDVMYLFRILLLSIMVGLTIRMPVARKLFGVKSFNDETKVA